MSTQPTLFDQQAVAMPKPALRCSQKTGQQLKKEGQTRAAGRHLFALKLAQETAKSAAMANGSTTIEGVRTLYESWYGKWDLGNAAGSVFAGPEWEWVGFVNSKRPAAHSRIIRTWRLKR